MEIYEEYNHIEKHIGYAQKLAYLNAQAKQFISEIEIQKAYKPKRFLGIVHVIYHFLQMLTKPSHLFASIIYNLDELLFYEVKSRDSFVIEDDEYPLSYVYFNTESWYNINTRQYKLEHTHFFDESEAALLSCFIDDYEHFILYLDWCLKDEKHRFIKKLRLTLQKLKRHLIYMKLHLLIAVSRNLAKKIDST